jgi:hypothetical protein
VSIEPGRNTGGLDEAVMGFIGPTRPGLQKLVLDNQRPQRANAATAQSQRGKVTTLQTQENDGTHDAPGGPRGAVDQPAPRSRGGC